MRYILKNKDKRVLEFEVEKDSETFEGQTISYTSLKNASIIDENLLPKQISPSHLLRSLESFIKHRKVPQNRQFANNILATIPTNEKNNLMAYIDISFGLSLNDSYWIVLEGKDYQWKDFNLYNNEFSEVLELSAFGLQLTKANGFLGILLIDIVYLEIIFLLMPIALSSIIKRFKRSFSVFHLQGGVF